MKKLALVFPSTAEKNPKKIFSKYISNIDFDCLFLCSNPKDKILKKDIDLNFDKLNDYKVICPVGAESLKYICALTGITKYNGVLIENKYIPLINPKLIEFKPQYKEDIIKACLTIEKTCNDTNINSSIKKYYLYITKEEDFKPVLDYLSKGDYIVCDIETSSLSPRKGNILGVGFSTRPHEGIYVEASIISKFTSELQKLFKEKIIVFHNGKFDMQWLYEEFKFKFYKFEDTILMHYCLSETVGTHGLKQLALRFTDLGDYERELDNFKKSFCRTNKILLKDFNYGMLPAKILSGYAVKDCDATAQLKEKFEPLIQNNDKFKNVYENILKPATHALMQLEQNGGPIHVDSAIQLYEDYGIDIEEAVNELKLDKDVARFERIYKKSFNPNSVMQLQTLFFELKNCSPIKKTSGGAWSVDKEVLSELNDPLAEVILDMREKVKLQNTYIHNILYGLDTDKRLRSNFNIFGTTSGRLSSSGVLNYQNIPRDNKDIKKLFKARDDYKIIEVDLGTAEVYVAAVLSKDKFLQEAFIKKLDFHSYIAKQLFGIPVSVNKIKGHPEYDKYRQYSKNITFGIMYQAGAAKIAETVNNTPGITSKDYITKSQASSFISKYFKEANKLKTFIDSNNAFISRYSYTYSFFGRKRRLPESQSVNRGVRSHAVRSGVNFLIQSVASDLNLLALIDSIKWIQKHNLQEKILPFTVVHDSIIAEVHNNYIDTWARKVKELMQKDRGLMISNCPIEVDTKIGLTWGDLKSYKYE